MDFNLFGLNLDFHYHPKSAGKNASSLTLWMAIGILIVVCCVLVCVLMCKRGGRRRAHTKWQQPTGSMLVLVASLAFLVVLCQVQARIFLYLKFFRFVKEVQAGKGRKLFGGGKPKFGKASKRFSSWKIIGIFKALMKKTAATVGSTALMAMTYFGMEELASALSPHVEGIGTILIGGSILALLLVILAVMAVIFFQGNRQARNMADMIENLEMVATSLHH